MLYGYFDFIILRTNIHHLSYHPTPTSITANPNPTSFLLSFNNIVIPYKMKKFLNNRLSTQPESQRRCIQHLQHDFMVQLYLQESTTAHSNYKSYIHLLNHITFANRNKKRQIKYLSHQTHSLIAKGEIAADGSGGRKEASRWNELVDFQKKIIEEEEIRNHLQAELNEVTKSINLMKGDVGRIIEKNQSTIILQKKSSKVKLIAHDQLKKVNLALHKDHAEILERNNMQIRFDKKLKDICNNQNNVLRKIQSEYLRLERRKKLINEKIAKMEDIMRNLSEREKTKEEIRIINERNRINFEEIMNLYDLIKQIQQKGDCSSEDKEEREDNLLDTHLSMKTIRFKTKVKEIQAEIINHIADITVEIEQSDKVYRNNADKLQQLKAKYSDLERQQKNYEEYLIDDRNYIITEQEQMSYDKKLASFKRSLNLLLIIWEFIQNHTNFTTLIDHNSNNNSDLKSKKQDASQSRFYRRSQEFQKNSSVLGQESNFSNKFYKLMLFLSGSGEQVNLQSQFIMKSLEMTIIMWLKGLKCLIVQEMNMRKTDKLKKAKSLESIKYKSTFQLLEQAQPNHNKYRLSIQQDEQDKLKTMLELISPKKSTIYAQSHHHKPSSLLNSHKMRKTQGDDDDCTAKRIKVLEKVDYDYYKMLKNVLQIEKQNIKKNYDFNKTFNRTKFTQKNILQEEKRYESNFALEFIKKNEQNMIMNSQRSIGSRVSQRDKFPKRKDFHYRTDMSYNHRRDSSASSRKGSAYSKPKESFFNARKLQRKSKLVQRQSQDAPNVYESRTSLFGSKKVGINFADQTVREQY